MQFMRNLLLAAIALFGTFFANGQCPTLYRASGGGTYCGTPLTGYLSGSDTGVTYQLFRSGMPSGSSVAGTGSALSFSLPGEGAYEIYGSRGSCTLMMTDTFGVARGMLAGLVGSTGFCTSDSGYFYDSTFLSGGTWSSSAPSVATVYSYGGGGFAMVKGLSAGSATISYSLTTACGTSTVVKTVNVYNTMPTPTISGPSALCTGSSAAFTSSAWGYPSWTTSSAAVASVDRYTGFVTGVSAGTAIISCTESGRCGTATGTASITVSTGSSTASIVGPFAVLPGTTATYTVSGASGGTWSAPTYYYGTITSGGVYSPISSDVIASILYTYTAGCGAASVGGNVYNTPAGATVSDSFWVNSITNCGATQFTTISKNYRSGMWLLTNYGDGIIDSSYYAPHGYGYSYGIDSFRHFYASPGVYNIRHYLIDGSGIIDSVAYTDTIVTLAAGITGPSYLTVGTVSSLLFTGTSSGFWYSTTSTATVGSSGTTGIVTPVALGVATIRYYATACRTTYTYSVPVFPSSAHVADSFITYPTDRCVGPKISIYSPIVRSGMQARTYFGDGSSMVSSVTGSGFTDTFNHAYATSGAYTIKTVLLASGTAIDSVVYTYNYLPCQEIAVAFYYDSDSNCAFNTGDFYNYAPLLLAVDSAGVTVDTISITSGVYFRQLGPVGTVYQYRILSTALDIVCPSSGVIYDTVRSSSSYSSSTKQVALRWLSGSSFDLALSHSSRTGRHTIQGTIVVTNYAGTATGGIVTMNFDSRYSYYRASPSPASTSSGRAIWSFSTLSPGSTTTIRYQLEVPGGSSAWLTIRDTVRTIIRVDPFTGDTDTTNNYINVLDTVSASFDPNMIAVTPSGNILNGTNLEYTIHFENQGNDTATNIHLLDTLSSNVDITSLRIVTATAAMNVSYTPYGSQTIVKFDFPNIKLPDSSHHNLCTGLVTYTINARRGLADGTTILNRTGIYFDDNEVVMTNTVTNTIVIPAITISARDTTLCIGDTASFTAVPHTAGNTHYQWFVNTTAVGTDATTYTTYSITTGDVVRCRMTTMQDDTIVTTSAPITISVSPVPDAGTITSRTVLCASDTVTATSTDTTGGTWSVAGSRATITGSLLRAVSIGADTLIYTVTNACGSDTATAAFTVNNVVTPAVTIAVTPSSTVCEGTTVTFTATPTNGGTTPRFVWKRFGVPIDSGISMSYVPTLGDVITCEMTTSAVCPSANRVTSSGITMTVHPEVLPAVSLYASASSIYASGELVDFYTTVSYGGTSPTFQWYVNGNPIPGATTNNFSYHVIIGDSIYCRITSNAPCASRSSAISDTIILNGTFPTSVGTLNTSFGTVKLFPNPNNGKFELSGLLNSGFNGIATYQIVDLPGRVWLENTINIQNGSFKDQVNANELAPGYYGIRLKAGTNTAYFNFIINK